MTGAIFVNALVERKQLLRQTPMATMAFFMTIVCWPAAEGHCASLPASSDAVLNETFSGSVLNSDRWTIAERAGNKAVGQLQCYTRASVSVNNGLVITAERKRKENEIDHCRDFSFVSGRLKTTMSFLYGRVSVRAKLLSAPGYWPAIWLRTPEGAPFNGEIDIVEGIGQQPNLVQSTVHGWENGVNLGHNCAYLSSDGRTARFPHLNNHCSSVSHRLERNFDEQFHDFEIDWRPTSITWSIDGISYYEAREYVPHEPMVLILELAVGGIMGGPVSTRTRSPAMMEIQEIRISPHPSGDVR